MDNDVEKLVKKTQKIIKSIDDYFIYVSNILSNVKYLPYKDERLVLKNTFSNLQNKFDMYSWEAACSYPYDYYLLHEKDKHRII